MNIAEQNYQKKEYLQNAPKPPVRTPHQYNQPPAPPKPKPPVGFQTPQNTPYQPPKPPVVPSPMFRPQGYNPDWQTKGYQTPQNTQYTPTTPTWMQGKAKAASPQTPSFQGYGPAPTQYTGAGSHVYRPPVAPQPTWLQSTISAIDKFLGLDKAPAYKQVNPNMLSASDQQAWLASGMPLGIWQEAQKQEKMQYEMQMAPVLNPNKTLMGLPYTSSTPDSQRGYQIPQTSGSYINPVQIVDAYSHWPWVTNPDGSVNLSYMAGPEPPDDTLPSPNTGNGGGGGGYGGYYPYYPYPSYNYPEQVKYWLQSLIMWRIGI